MRCLPIACALDCRGELCSPAGNGTAQKETVIPTDMSAANGVECISKQISLPVGIIFLKRYKIGVDKWLNS